MSILSSKKVWAIVGVILLCATCFVLGAMTGHDQVIMKQVMPITLANRDHLSTLNQKIKDMQVRVQQNEVEIQFLKEAINKAIAEHTIKGVASWYGIGDGCGLVTATGERFDISKFTVAHKTLPLGTYVIVRNCKTGKQAFGIINDRGPYIKGRDFDLSWSMAEYLGFTGKGLARVEVIILGRRQS